VHFPASLRTKEAICFPPPSTVVLLVLLVLIEVENATGSYPNYALYINSNFSLIQIIIRVTVPLKAVMVDEKKRQLFSICSKLRNPDTQRLFFRQKGCASKFFSIKI
jgi:hypothetical protein